MSYRPSKIISGAFASTACKLLLRGGQQSGCSPRQLWQCGQCRAEHHGSARGTTRYGAARTERDSDKWGIHTACVASRNTLELNRPSGKTSVCCKKHFLFRCFIKSVFLGCYCHSFQGVRAEKGNSAIALDGMLVFKLMRAKPQAITEKIQASLSPPTPPVTQHALHCAKEGSSKHWSSCLSI